jgi:quercetin dioxygenase-like cupin family protein
MPIKIEQPTIVEPAGNKYKRIEEFVGLVNSNTSDISLARVVSPPGWEDPFQKPEYTECRFVTKGTLLVKTGSEVFFVHAGEVIIVNANERVQYCTPGEDGAEYISVCAPAFSQDMVHRDE